MTKLSQIAILFFVFNCYAQKQINLKGIVSSNRVSLNQVHIFNVNTAKGTLSNSRGEFEIDVHLNDVLVINVMPYREKQIMIQKEEINTGKIRINLKEDITKLDLVEVSNKKLTGNLLLDSNKVPVDSNGSFKQRFTVDLSNINFDAKPIYIDNDIVTRGLEEVSSQNNYMNISALAGKLITKIKKKRKAKKDQQLARINIKNQFRKRISDEFFIKELKIPKPHIDDFLEEYCKEAVFINLYEENKIIECIEFLIEKNKLGKYCVNSN